jgi:hypothetical protein
MNTKMIDLIYCGLILTLLIGFSVKSFETVVNASDVKVNRAPAVITKL